MAKVLVSAPYLLPYLKDYEHFFNRNGVEPIKADVKERLEEEELIPMVNDIDGALAGDDRYTERVLSAATNLKVISKWGTGIDSFDKEAAKKRGVKIYNIPGAFNEPVSESVIGYILSFARNLPFMDREMHVGNWEKLLGTTLAETTIGVIGVGEIGKTVIQKLSVFAPCILGNDIQDIDQKFLTKYRVEMVSKAKLLKESDFISINCDLNPTSYHLIDSSAFSTMQNNSVIVNCARGPIIETDALVEAVKKRKIAGAALDVFEKEPLPTDSPLIHMDNVLMAPHNSNSSPKAWRRVHLLSIRNVLRGLDIYDDELEQVQ